MYDPSTANTSSHRASPARTYIMNMLGLTKTGFWVDMPNRYVPQSAPVAYQPWEDKAVQYNPQIANYVSKKVELNKDDSTPSKPLANMKIQTSAGGVQASEPHTIQPILLNTGHGFMDVLEGGKKEGGAIKTADFVAGGVITQKDMVKGAKLDLVNKPKPKKLQQKQGLNQKIVAPTVSNRNYYQPQPYQSQVKSLNSRGY